MKFNERELAAWAATFNADKEGILEKKGAGLGQGYRLRWFRLKNNLLFYYKMDDNGDWQHHGDPLGVIVLERVSVENYIRDNKPYTFVLSFEGDDSRTYFLSAYSDEEMKRWMKAIQAASYEGLKKTLYELQTRLQTLTGQDPLKDKTNCVGPQFSAEKVKHHVHEVKRSLYIRTLNMGRAKKLVGLASAESPPQYELTLSCSSLPLEKDGSSPNTVVRVRSYRKSDDAKAHSTVGLTDVIQSSVSPSFTHLILLHVGPDYTSVSTLEFEVFSVNESEISDASLEKSCKLTIPKDDSSSVVLDCATLSENIVRKGVCIGRTLCPVSQITESRGKEVKLLLSTGKLVSGFLHVLVQKIEDNYSPERRYTSKKKYSGFGNLPTIMSHPIRCHFSFPASIRGQSTKLKVVEEMAESVFNIQVPIELLKCYIKEDTMILDELTTLGAVEDSWKDMITFHQGVLLESISTYKSYIKILEGLGDTCGYKPSTQKKDKDLNVVLCNLHIQRLRVMETESGKHKETSYVTVTSGCPADHVTGFRNGGLHRMLSECKNWPSFVFKGNVGVQSPLVQIKVRLAEIKANIYDYSSKLYRACANASPHNMNDAMIGISKEIQQLFFLMESQVVKEAVESLIGARPCSSSNDTTLLNTSSLDNLAAHVPKEMRRISMKRRSVALPSTKCNCGRCSKCVPTPSDWIWNGTKFVQVSKEWKMSDSSGSIQSSLCTLIENVEAATQKVVNQQHEAVAQEYGLRLKTYKPSYVWSLELIPMFARLNQTLDGLFKVASTSLSFALLRHDTAVPNLKIIRRRKDVVFSQVLTALVTSFYSVLSHNFANFVFMRQLRKIGFLIQFESLLSSLGDELGMLEDMCIAVAELATVQFQIAEVKGQEDVPYDFRIKGTRGSLVIQLLLSREILSQLEDVSLKQGERISVVPILFAQGVNEKQTLADIKHDLLLQFSLKLQDEVNTKSLKILEEYVVRYEMLMQELKSTSKVERPEDESVRTVKELHNLLLQSHSTQKSKNVEFLLLVERLVYCLHGGRHTCCKSGKDRTGMSVTLEECCSLRNNHHLNGDTFDKTLSTLRSHGTRLENCLKNTGHRCYHFNQLQLMLLPKLLTPPPFTCRDPE